MDGPVWTLAVNGTDLYAGGAFTKAGNATADLIAGWNGSTWSALNPGMDRYVYTLTASGTNLYAGGSFTRARLPVGGIFSSIDGSRLDFA